MFDEFLYECVQRQQQVRVKGLGHVDRDSKAGHTPPCNCGVDH
jgi:hypothetical protein